MSPPKEIWIPESARATSSARARKETTMFEVRGEDEPAVLARIWGELRAMGFDELRGDVACIKLRETWAGVYVRSSDSQSKI